MAVDVLARLRAGASGLCLSSLLCDEMDALLIHGFEAAEPPAKVALVAVGGLGRRERSPKSDVDLLVLHDTDVTAFSDRFLYPLWDAKIDLGHGVRTVGETVALCEKDEAALTSHLDARLLAGDETLFSQMRAELRSVFKKRGPAYVERLLEPIRDRARAESLVFVLEPHLKTGPGGLRDIHQIGWVRTLVKDALSDRERTQLMAARSFFLRTRAYLHELAKRRQDQISFELQPELAAELGWDVEHLLTRHYRHAQQVIDIKHRLFLRIGTPKKRLRVDKPSNVLRLFLDSLEQDLPIADETIDAITAVEDDPETFWRIIDHPHGDRALLDMHYAGVLGRYLPEFGRTRGMVQADFYHSHTVDVHTLRVLELLYALRRGEGDSEFDVRGEQSWRSLVMGCMFHDAGKRSGRKHEEYGAELVERAMVRLGAPLADIVDAQLLVREHLAMPKISQRRDLSDPELIAGFAKTVENEARLRRLYVLSYVDTCGTGPNLWTPWKAALLKELYERTLAHLKRQPLPSAPLPPRKEPGVWLDAEAHGHRALWVVTPDRPGILALVAGLCAAKRVSIAGADVVSSEEGVAMDRFMIRGERYDELVKEITQALADKRAIEAIVVPAPRKHLGPRPEPRVHKRERTSLGHVLEVQAVDRAGLLFDVTRTLYEQGYSINSARIVTEGARAIDVFYVEPEPTDALCSAIAARL